MFIVSSCDDNEEDSANSSTSNALEITQEVFLKGLTGNYRKAAYFTDGEYVDAGDSGEGVVWDFSEINTTLFEEYDQSISLCPNTRHCDQYPASDFVEHDLDFRSNLFYTINKDEFNFLGFYEEAPIRKTELKDVELVFKFPIRFGQEFMDSYFTEESPTADRTTVETIVDGIGRLITPAGSFEQTLRVKKVRTIFSENINGNKISSKIINYTWIDKEGKRQFLVTHIFSGENTNTEVLSTALEYLIEYRSL